MHTAFTGSARKPRQVNLSGRNTTNPWAALSNSSKPSNAPSGSHSAVVQAQADRVRRQQERDRVNAAKKIQKTWRGHASRTLQKQKWREEWDDKETGRLKMGRELAFHQNEHVQYPNMAYLDSNSCLDQLRLLVRFLDIRLITDTSRLLFFGDAMKSTFEGCPSFELDQAWRENLKRLSRFVSGQIEYIGSRTAQAEFDEHRCIELLGLNTFVTGILPDVVALDATYHFSALQHLIVVSGRGNTLLAAVAGYTITILSHTTKTQLQTFTALASGLLTKPEVQYVSPLMEFLRHPLQQNLLSKAILQLVQTETSSKVKASLSTESQLWLLSYMTFLRKEMPITHVKDSKAFPAWLDAFSVLLSQCANEIAARIDETDQPMDGSTSHVPFPPFIQEQISALAQQSSVVQTMDQLRKFGGSDESVQNMATPLANYAVALLRAFPARASNIRMWLYRGSPSISGDQSLSTIRYLWKASAKTAVFQKIRNQRNVLSVLVEAAPDHNQIGRAQTSSAEISTWQAEWRIVLLFMELYTFILKLMDDEEFFALDSKHAFSSRNDRGFSSFQKGALPLDDVAQMTTFLKNLAFPLYWNAADLDESNEVEDAGGLAALFGTAPVEQPRPIEKKAPQTLAGNGVSQAYLKGLVTGLLRMLHERDSRRKFLPDDHWLMTKHFDMQGFIPAVVLEEERRHEYGEEGEEGPDELNGEIETSQELEYLDPDALVPSLTTMFGIRAPHTSRTQTSRFAEQMRRRREIAKRKRLSESLAPRLEILRNLPFFIPFDTRVQIFREFIYCDQLKRRNGYVDPDQWRMSVASGTQGRGLDGRPRGIELLGRHRAEIRRGSVFEDAYEQFYDLGEELKEPIQISFIDQFGATEAGIDGGGVTKEFLISVTSEAFDPQNDMQMFVENDQRYLFPNPTKYEAIAESLRRRGMSQGSEQLRTQMRELLRQYEFLGRVIGKCLYEGILVDIVFAGFFLLKWALTGGSTSATNESAYRASINDLRDFDESLYQGLLTLKNYEGDVETDFGLNFTVTDEMKVQGRNFTVTKDLIPNGSNTSVTNANRLVYIDKITRYRLQYQPSLVTNAFLKGLGRIIQPMWLAMFNQRELQKLVGGDNAELDIVDLRRNTQYGGLYVIGDDGLEHPTVALFWKVLKEMNDDDRRKVLKFVTSTPRAPLLGFGHLNPKFSIRDSSEDQTRLPSTSTCVNLLKLPRYGDERTMREKLLYAVNSGAGFDLS